MNDLRKSLIDSMLCKVLKRLHYPLEVMLTCVRWYEACPLSLRHVGEMMQERGLFVDHSTVHRWAMKVRQKMTQPMLGFKSFWSARILIAGIKTMHMVKKGQMVCPRGSAMSAAQQFYSLAV